MTAVAITGMAVLLPGAPDLATYWHNIVHGVDAIGDLPAHRWPGDAEEVYCLRGGFVDAEIDLAPFGIAPNSVAGTEPDQLIALRVAAAAIADAGGDARLPDRSRVGVILGRGGYLTPGLARLDQQVRTARQLVHTLREVVPSVSDTDLDRVRAAFIDSLGPADAESVAGLVPNLAASRIANRLDLRGPAYTVDAACASSLVAVDHAVRDLASGRCDAVLAGGVHHCHDLTLWSVFARLGALSRSARSRPFHRDADGILLGEGTGVVVLRRLDDAVRDGARIYAVIRGTGVSSDGRSGGLLTPSASGEADAVRGAWHAAGLDPTAPGSIGLLEAHGTATPAGDAAELAAIAEVFGPGDPADRPVLGSVKSMIGHTMPAAGVAALVKAALAVHHGVLPPSLHCDEPHPGLAATRFRVTATAEPWDGPRRAGVNAFGFGGVNAHVVLDQAPDRASAAVTVTEPESVLMLSAGTAEEMARQLDAPDEALRAKATRWSPPEGGPARLAVVGPAARRLALARRMAAAGRPWRGRDDVWFVPKPLLGAGGGRTAFVFPGLESEFAADVDDVATALGLPWTAPSRSGEPVVGDVARHAKEVIRLGGFLAEAMGALGVTADGMAGHSVGEWTAMASSGMCPPQGVAAFTAALRPDRLRLPDLSFAVLTKAATEVGELLAEWPDIVLSHDNSPHQSLVCGPVESVRRLLADLGARGVLGRTLPFRSGFHTPMLAPHVGSLRTAAAALSFAAPGVAVWSATTARPYPSAEPDVRALFVRHLLEPVRFRALTEAMYEQGFRAFVQLGVGQLPGMIADTLGERAHLAVTAHDPRRPGLAQLSRTAAALWTDGGTPEWPRPAAAGSGLVVRLDLGGGLVSLTGRTPALASGSPTALDDLAARFPVAGELSALVREVTGLAVSAARLSADGPARRDLAVSVDAMPYLVDHCFFRQRPGWPDLADRWPVVPATTILHQLVGVAEQAEGRAVTAVENLELRRWLVAVPARTVTVSVERVDGDRFTCTLGDHARATLVVDGRYPPPPPPWPVDRTAERRPALTAEDLYADRWMFHGPRFRGVAELVAVGPDHLRGTLVTPRAPGGLLDNVGQLLGAWLIESGAPRAVVFPAHVARIAFHGPHPAPGTRLDCLLRVRAVTGDSVVADAQLLSGGRVWAEITGWRDRRFGSDQLLHDVFRYPERRFLGEPRPGGEVVVRERWTDLASRELVMRNYLATAERAEYDRCPAPRRQAWLLRVIAVKDAVRSWLRDHGVPDVFPAEIAVTCAPDGHVAVTGRHGRDLPRLVVSVSGTGTRAQCRVRAPG
ncbi:beta-ketoacyl synthase N-terminal-like domain-containing protein [Actinophytocola oryzae]|uniref:Acyl transferase domain-containing protein n=1 Tax=Actinophytocola oryzae TaxID=502181 RepID=A0A4R7W0V1_9PSEU|nr:beta-ketoacyl synthase N-terminal-like domain-containing protein [Actinophytocola oryzae]TDV56074.1 acyl transferase domain-containing protein [Actinophytocola oryzae]